MGGIPRYRRPGAAISGRRYYSPTLGRFVNRDPSGESGGLSLYAFCLNNPVNSWDYLGLLGGGVIVAGNVDVGVGGLGGGSTQGSAGFMGFSGGRTSLPSNGGFLSGGGFLRERDYSKSVPNNGQKPAALGISAGVGAGLCLTSADNAGELAGPFSQYNLNTMWFSASYATDGKNWLASITLGPSLKYGASISKYPTTTVSGTLFSWGGNSGQTSSSPPNTFGGEVQPGTVEMAPFEVKTDHPKEGEKDSPPASGSGKTGSGSGMSAGESAFVEMEGATVITDPDAIAGIMGSISLFGKPQMVLPTPTR